MTRPNYTHLDVLLDRSGSMYRIKTDTEGGLAALLKEQREAPGKATFALRQFDDRYEVVVPPMDIAKVTDPVIEPRGNTALYDAMGKAIQEAGDWLSSLPEHERPSQVIFAVVTDGFENASHEWTASGVKALVKRQEEKYGWKFAYIGANQDAFAEGRKIGIGQTMGYSGQSVDAAYAQLSTSIAGTRSGSAWSVPKTAEKT